MRGERGSATAACSMRLASRIRAARRAIGWAKAAALNSAPMPAAALADQARRARRRCRRPRVGGLGLERGGARLDAETAQELRLRRPARKPLAPIASTAARQRLEIDMRGEIDVAGRGQRIGIGVLADRLQGVADGAFGMAVVDHQRGAAVAREPPAELQRDGVGAPFEDRAVGRVAQRPAAAVGRNAASDRARS